MIQPLQLIVIFLCNCAHLSGGFIVTSTTGRFTHTVKDSNLRRSSNDGLISRVNVSERYLEFRMRAVSSAAIENVNDFYQSAPYLAAFLTCGVKASAADLVAQRSAQDNAMINYHENDLNMNTKVFDVSDENNYSCGKVDIPRNTAFILYGGLYQGVTQEYIFNHVYPLMFGVGTDVITVASKVVFDMLILSPFLCLPAAYLAKGLIFQQRPVISLHRYREDIVERGLLVKYWMVWAPVQCFTFSIVPEHFRIAFIALISFFWLILLSSISSESSSERI